MDEVRKYRKIDAHEHVGLGGTLEDQLKIADKLGIETLVISRPKQRGDSDPFSTMYQFSVTQPPAEDVAIP